MYIHFFKRLFDVIVAFAALIILFVPFIIIAFLIKLESKGPIMFKQNRVGINGKIFKIYKFRSMYTTAPHDAATNSLEHVDEMITKIGKGLRKSSIDELPQFINVLKG